MTSSDNIDEDSDMEDVDRLRKSIRNMDLDKFAEETCKPYNEALNKTLQKELTKTKEFREVFLCNNMLWFTTKNFLL